MARTLLRRTYGANLIIASNIVVRSEIIYSSSAPSSIYTTSSSKQSIHSKSTFLPPPQTTQQKLRTNTNNTTNPSSRTQPPPSDHIRLLHLKLLHHHLLRLSLHQQLINPTICRSHPSPHSTTQNSSNSKHSDAVSSLRKLAVKKSKGGCGKGWDCLKLSSTAKDSSVAC